jgi:hypothetical protein
MIKKLMLLALYFMAANEQLAFAQRTCGTMDAHQHMIHNDTDYEENRDSIEQFTQHYISHIAPNKKTRALVTIPVVFHVVYQNATENISDTYLLAQLDQLNLDFAKMNTDTNLIPTAFKSLLANTDIQFCLAVRDPSGNPTTGITRTSTTVASFNTNNAVKSSTTGGANGWPRDSYLNFWVCDLGSSLLGYAQFPGGNAATDGVVCNYNTVGSMLLPSTNTGYNLGRTATHEVGHWLNLFHIWGDDGGTCTGSDLVNDTPNQEDASAGCPTYPLIDACATVAPGAMFMNYMDYVADACMQMFTAGQAVRMQAVFAPGGARYNITLSQGCVPVLPCAGMPNGGSINATSDTILCQNNVGLTLSGASNGLGISLQWQSSPDNITWTNITGATTTNTSVLASALNYGPNYFRCAVTCSTSNSTTNSIVKMIYKAGIYSFSGDTICNIGSISLFAQGATGTTNWYSNANGSGLLFTGNPYNTTVSGATTYYVQSVNLSNYTVGAPDSTIGGFGTNAFFTNGLVFNTFQDVTIDTVFVYPTGAGNLKVMLYDSSTGLAIDSFSQTIVAAQINAKVPVPVNLFCPSGGTYRITPTGSTVSGLKRNTSGFTYPYTVPSVISITGPVVTSQIRYPFFYDWRISSGCNSAIIPVPVVINGITVSAVATSPLCAGSFGGIVASATGSGVQYKINSGAYSTNNIFNNLVAGSYTITAKNANNCTATTVALITIPTTIAVGASAVAATIGNNGSVTATATGGSGLYTYSLNGGVYGASNIFSALAPGNYTVCTQDANGCSNCSTTIVTSATTVIANAVNTQASCATSSIGIITASGAGATGSYQYSINGGAYQTSPMFNSLAAGNYTITVKDNTSATTGTTVVTVAVSTPSFTSVTSTNATSTMCIGTISALGAGSNAPYSYALNAAAATSNGNFTALCAGTYTLCVIDAIGCSACTTETVIAADPLAFIVPINTTQPCFNNTNGSLNAPATGGIAPLEYTIGSAYASSSTFNSLAPGIYTVTVKDFTNATLSTTVDLTLSSNLLFNASQSASISCNNLCSGEITGNFLNGVMPYSYVLNGGVASGSNTFSSLCAGTYTMQATDANGCTKSYVVTLSEPLPLSSNLQISQIRCTNDNDGSISATGIGGVGPYEYSIDGGLYSAPNTFSALIPATYTIAVQDANSCTVSTLVTITQSTVLLGLTATSTPTTGSNNGTITATGSNGTAPYIYSLNGGTPTTNNIFSALANGNYTLTVTDVAGCAKTTIVGITFAENLNTLSFIGNVNIYPNPAKDVINIDAETKGSSAVQIQIIDVLGQVVYKNYAVSTNGSINTSIDVSSFASGHYEVMLMDDLRRVAVKQVTIK